MNIMSLLVLLLSLGVSTGWSSPIEHIIENQFLSRTIILDNGTLYTSRIINKVADKELIPKSKLEFQLRISEGTDIVNSDVILNSTDFVFEKVLIDTRTKKAFLLRNNTHKIDVEVHYELGSAQTYLNKFLRIRTAQPITLERIDVDVISAKDIYQPYQIKQITAYGPSKWRPGLGQPLFTKKSSTFWGTEFPASFNLDLFTAQIG